MDGRASTHFDPNMSSGWDDSQHGSPSARVNQYNNETFGRAGYFYTTSDPSGDALSSPSPDSSYGSAATSIIAKVKNSVPDKLERRREQNRSSQRAYRERRERQQRELEAQIANLDPFFDMDPTEKMQNPYARMYNEP
ncbi:hypothetical protein DV737_g1477, partial [Chaetothyriales sp. CBS 132003]